MGAETALQIGVPDAYTQRCTDRVHLSGGTGMDVRTCDHCGRPGTPYEYKGQIFDGLHANRGERLCPGCLDVVVDTEGVNIAFTNKSGTYTGVINTVADRDKVFPSNPEGIDGRDLRSHARRPRRRSA
jgi:hypothetical protein